MVLLILAMMTDIGTASIITAFIIVVKFMTQSYKDRNAHEYCGVEAFETEKEDAPSAPAEELEKKQPSETQPVLKPEVILENAEMLDDILYPKSYSADDKIFNASVVSGYKEKKAKEIRSHWNNNNWKRYYDYELGAHARENRDWWTDDDFELSKKHVVI